MIEKIELRVTCDLLKVTKLLNSRTKVRCRFYDSEKHRQINLELAKRPHCFPGSFETGICYSVVNSWYSSLERASSLFVNPLVCVCVLGVSCYLENGSSVGVVLHRESRNSNFCCQGKKKRYNKNKLVNPNPHMCHGLIFNKIPNISKPQFPFVEINDLFG